MEYKGIDVSAFQGDIDWEKVKDDGVEFAIVRAGFGDGNVDEKFEQNASECNRLGIPMGIYWFSYAYTEEMAVNEAKFCLEQAEKYRLEYPIFYDFEGDSIRFAKENGVDITAALGSDIVNSFCQEVQSNKYYASFYSDYDLITRLFQPYLRQRYALWFAQYAQNPDITDSIIWQYSSLGRIAGIDGNVDLDVAFENLPDIIKKAGLNGLTTNDDDHECDCQCPG